MPCFIVPSPLPATIPSYSLPEFLKYHIILLYLNQDWYSEFTSLWGNSTSSLKLNRLRAKECTKSCLTWEILEPESVRIWKSNWEIYCIYLPCSCLISSALPFNDCYKQTTELELWSDPVKPFLHSSVAEGKMLYNGSQDCAWRRIWWWDCCNRTVIIVIFDIRIVYVTRE